MIRRINNHSYQVTSDFTELSEGAAVVYSTLVLSFISFVDNVKQNGILHSSSGQVLVVSFKELELVTASTNPNDGTPMLT